MKVCIDHGSHDVLFLDRSFSTAVQDQVQHSDRKYRHRGNISEGPIRCSKAKVPVNTRGQTTLNKSYYKKKTPLPNR
jgi:hypothetical protein